MCIAGRLFYPAREAVLFEAGPNVAAGSFRTASARYPTENHIMWWAFAVNVALAEPRPLFFG